MTGAQLVAAPPRTPRLWLRSLTSRLVAGVVALVAVLVCAIGASTYYALKSFLNQRLDQQLDSTITGQLQQVFTGPREPSTLLRPLDVWAVALSPDGKLLTYPATGAAEPMRLTPADRLVLAHVQAHSPVTVTTTDGHQLRVETTERIPVRINDSPPLEAIAAVGLSTGEEHRTLDRLLASEIVIGVCATLIALLATWVGVQRGLRNLYRVTGTAQEVAAELSPAGKGLERRVPVVEEGTEVGQLAESVNTLLAAVETQFKARVESEQRMRQFLADASHELRTPLTSIRGYAELARMRRAAQEPGEPHADNLDRIESEGTRMSRLVDDLLLLARGESDGAARLEHRVPVDLADIVDDAVSGSRASFPDRPIEAQLEELPAVVGDRDQLLRVVRNLITNSAVHTAAGRPILVRGFSEAGGVVVTVADGGPGLPPEQAAHVFERFWRADKARTRARGGSGLGLSIVAAIVRAHGGTVRFDSDVETGSTVTVWLPTITE